MTDTEKKEFLNKYRANEWEIAHLQEELALWESRAGRVTSSWAAVPGGGVGAGFQFCVDYIAEYRQELQERLVESLRLRRGIESAISALSDARLRQVMRHRYLDGFTIAATAEKMNYSTRQVDNMIVSAMRRIELGADASALPVS